MSAPADKLSPQQILLFYAEIYADLFRETTAYVQYPLEFAFTNVTHSNPVLYRNGMPSLVFTTVLVAVMLTVVGLRTWAIRRYGRRYGWKSARGASDACVLFAAVLGVVYLTCMAVYYREGGRCNFFEVFERGEVINGELLRLVGPEREGGAAVDEVRGMKVEEIRCDLRRTPHVRTVLEDQIQLASHYILAIIIWTVKLGFLAVFYEFHSVLSRKSKWFLYGITAYSVATMISAICYTIYANIVAVHTAIAIEEGSGIGSLALFNRVSYDALRLRIELKGEIKASITPFVFVTPEYVLSATDIVLEILLMTFIILIIRTLQLTRSEFHRALIFISPGIATVIVSVLRILYLEGSIIRYNQTKNSVLEPWSNSTGGAGGATDIIAVLRKGPEGLAPGVLEYRPPSGDPDELARVRAVRGTALAVLTPLWAFLGIIVVCIPGLRILMRRWRGGNSNDHRNAEVEDIEMASPEVEAVGKLTTDDSVSLKSRRRSVGEEEVSKNLV